MCFITVYHSPSLWPASLVSFFAQNTQSFSILLFSFFLEGIFEEIIVSDKNWKTIGKRLGCCQPLLSSENQPPRWPPTILAFWHHVVSSQIKGGSLIERYCRNDPVQLLRRPPYSFSDYLHSYYKPAYSKDPLVGLWRAPGSIEINSQHHLSGTLVWVTFSPSSAFRWLRSQLTSKM